MLELHHTPAGKPMTTTGEAVIKAQFKPPGNNHCRKTQKNSVRKESWEIAGI
jgi:hypothetical protein